VELLRETGASAVVHLAFVVDPLRAGVLDLERMWRINVAGTARVVEAVAEVNRRGGGIKKFIFPSSVSVYGPDVPAPIREDAPHQARHLAYAVHKKEADEVVRLRAASLGDCSTYVLRPSIFVGPTVENYMVGVLRGNALGRGSMGMWLRRRGARLPLLLPFGSEYHNKRFQFLHVDDMARLIHFILCRQERGLEVWVMNVAGRGGPLTIREGTEIAGARTLRLPGRGLCRLVVRLMWTAGISSVPPEAFAYMTGQYVMDTRRLQVFLGGEYEQVIRHTCAEALETCFAAKSDAALTAASA
jgi:nucleoside-diphosphate-sugar epimerase